MNQIKNYLQDLDQYIEYLSMAASYRREEFVVSPLVFAGAERFILLGFQQVMKISKLLSENNGFECTVDMRQCFQVMGENKVFPCWVSRRLCSMLKWVWPYEQDGLSQMDKNCLYDLLDDIIGVYRHFYKYVYEYID